MIILLFACDEKSKSSAVISNESEMDTEYRIDLNWDENKERLKTGVNIIWKKWRDNPSFTFTRYEIWDVTTNQPKWINSIEQLVDTTYQVEFPTGTFYRLCVLAHYHDISNEEFLISSDSVQFFTQPLSPITNLDVFPQSLENEIVWDASPDQDINKLIIYRAEILDGYDPPTLETSMISNNTGEIEDSVITMNNCNDDNCDIGYWRKIYEGTNLDVLYHDTDASDPNYTYYYTINIKIEDEGNDAENVIANYRYSLIVPENDNDQINLIQDETIILSVEDDQDNIIVLNWTSYEPDDFYSYEIWRTDVESMDIESLENNGEKLVEITTKSQNFFEDISLVGSEKTFYYFIRVNNNYGDTIDSNIVEGDTTL